MLIGLIMGPFNYSALFAGFPRHEQASIRLPLEETLWIQAFVNSVLVLGQSCNSRDLREFRNLRSTYLDNRISCSCIFSMYADQAMRKSGEWDRVFLVELESKLKINDSLWIVPLARDSREVATGSLKIFQLVELRNIFITLRSLKLGETFFRDRFPQNFGRRGSRKNDTLGKCLFSKSSEPLRAEIDMWWS
jgi:hypothetical protein